MTKPNYDKHPAAPTNPTRPGAPLPTDMEHLPTMAPGAILAELARAEVELMYATAKHRKAWAAMRRHANHRAELEASGTIGGLCTLESDPVWKQRTGDVSWWRDEMAAQATTVLALNQMLADQTPPPVEPPRSLVFSPPGEKATVRQIVFNWHTNRDERSVARRSPTEQEFQAATNWKRAAGESMREIDRRVCDALIRAWYDANPGYPR